MESTMRKLTLFLAGFSLLVAAAPSLAHHSFAAEYDANKPINLTGKVTKIEWTNPHVWFYVDTKDDSGDVVLSIYIKPDVRIRPFDLCDLARQVDRFIGVIFCCKGMMRK